MDRLNLSSEKFQFSMTNDIKMDNILLGIMPASSSYPCPFCEAFHTFEKKGDLRTIKRIKELAAQFKKSKQKPADYKAAKCCIHDPLIEGQS